MKILNFGSLNIDHVYQVAHFVRPKETLGCADYRVFPGGKGLNQSVALARAWATVAHAGKIGRDGRFLADFLREAGVDTGWLTECDTPTGHAVIQIDPAGQNAILLYPGANRAWGESEQARILDAQTPGTVVLVQNEISGVAALIDAARSRNLPVALNPSPCDAEALKFPLAAVDYLFVNELEGAALAGCAENEPERALDILSRRFPELEVVLTLGGDGAWFACGAGRCFVPAEPAAVVDTTCAGDTFSGYFLASRLAGDSPERALRRAAHAAALTVSRAGAAVSIPAAAEVDAARGIIPF